MKVFMAVMTLIAEREELVYRVGTGAASRHAVLRLAIASSLSGECMIGHFWEMVLKAAAPRRTKFIGFEQTSH